VMLASSVTFLPRFLGALPKAHLPLRDQAYSGRSEVFEFISSLKTMRSASTPSTTQALQAALRNSSRSPAARIFFSAPPKAPELPAHSRPAD
jgi:hypothetical protein